MRTWPPRIWFGLVALVVAVAFVIQFVLLFTGGADANSGDDGDALPLGVRFARLFSFFTVDTNVVVLIAAIMLAVRGVGGVFSRVVYLSALMSISVTGALFSFLLDPEIQLTGAAALVTNLFHVVSPIMFILGWVLWGPRRIWTWWIAVLAFAWPVAWLVFTFIRGAITGWYPYLVLDVGRVGFGAAVLSAALVLGFAVVLTAIVLLIDRKAPALSPGSSTETP